MGSNSPAAGSREPMERRLVRALWQSLAGLLVAAGATYAAMSTPTCDGAAAEDLLVQAFNGSPAARARGLAAVQVQGATGLSYSFGDAQRTCSGAMLLNNGSRLPVRFTLTGSRWDGVSVVADWR